MAENASPEVAGEIARLRESKGWTQQGLADRAGVKRSTVADYERADRKPKIENLTRIAKALNVPVKQLGIAYDPEAPRPHKSQRKKQAVESPAAPDDVSANEGRRIMGADIDNPRIQAAVGLFKSLTPEQQQETLEYMVSLGRTRKLRAGNKRG